MASRYFIKKQTLRIVCPCCKDEITDRFRPTVDPRYAVLLELKCPQCTTPNEIRCPVYKNKEGKSVY